LAGCSATQVDIPSNEDAAENLDFALEAWAKYEPSVYRYTMIYLDSSGCATHRYVVKVRNRRTESSSNRPIVGSCGESNTDIGEKTVKPRLAAGLTVTNLLTSIALTNCPLYGSYNKEVQCANEGAFFEARYHPQMGFPIFFDNFYGEALDERFGHVLDRQAIKYDFGYRITKFQIIE
jgi:hypothetical protein